MLENVLKPDDHFTFDELKHILTTENRLLPKHKNDPPLNEGTVRTWMSKIGAKREDNGYYSIVTVSVLVCWLRSRDNLKSIKFIPPLLKEKPNAREDIERELRIKYVKSDHAIDITATDTQD